MSITSLLYAFETHNPALIEKCIRDGVDPNSPIDGKTPLLLLIEMYMRSPRFADCLAALTGAGATADDPLLLALLSDDADGIRRNLSAALKRRFQLDCAYVSLAGVSALHVCAEYNAVRCARMLIDAGADINDRAAIDADGVGGASPLFHAVNSNQNHCRPVMELLVDAGADLDLRVPALSWGRGCDWETTIFAVTPISFAQCGLLPQFHRRPEDIYSNIDYMHRRLFKAPAPVRNVPNRYLRV